MLSAPAAPQGQAHHDNAEPGRRARRDDPWRASVIDLPHDGSALPGGCARRRVARLSRQLAEELVVLGDLETRRLSPRLAQTVSLDGWVLSRTEARLGGLCSLV